MANSDISALARFAKVAAGPLMIAADRRRSAFEGATLFFLFIAPRQVFVGRRWRPPGQGSDYQQTSRNSSRRRHMGRRPAARRPAGQGGYHRRGGHRQQQATWVCGPKRPRRGARLRSAGGSSACLAGRPLGRDLGLHRAINKNPQEAPGLSRLRSASVDKKSSAAQHPKTTAARSGVHRLSLWL